MGALDYCYCEYPLPIADAPREDWQTKDFACAGRQIIIRADGTLWESREALLPNPDWLPMVTNGLIVSWRPANTVVVSRIPLIPVVARAALMRIYTRLSTGRFVDVYFSVAADGRSVCDPQVYGAPLRRGT